MKQDGDELEHAIENRKRAREMARDAAMRGNAICGAYFALRDSSWLARSIDDASDYDDNLPDDDDIRPF